MAITLQRLPYPPDALIPQLSAEAVSYHHDHHEKGYVDTVNSLLSDESVAINDTDLSDIAARSSGPLANAAAQAWNHAFYWTCLAPNKTRPDPRTTLALEESFGSVEAFRTQFIQSCLQLFGSGWVWLVRSSEGRLDILPTPNAGLRVHEDRLWPLLVCDVWEHAYYIDYRGNRARYIEGFIELLNWNRVAERMRRSTSAPGSVQVASRGQETQPASPKGATAGSRHS